MMVWVWSALQILNYILIPYSEDALSYLLLHSESYNISLLTNRHLVSHDVKTSHNARTNHSIPPLLFMGGHFAISAIRALII